MEKGPFEDVFPIAMLDYRRVPTIAMFKGSYLFQGPSVWVSSR